ncbi:MAG: Ig-like domain-containing protein, partial [Planctomycetota bacterium]|nr:Ig-like domain-containing protein [Planctomycetota bacterium]
TTLIMDTAAGLLENDGGGVVTAFDSVSLQGATVTVAPDGSFDYVPPAGFTGMDSFTYTNVETATVTITVTGMIWFVDDTDGVPGDGRQASPFPNLDAFNAANASGGAGEPQFDDTIYLAEGTGSRYDGGVELQQGPRLVGAGADLAADGVPLIPAGARPVVTNTMGPGVTLASGCSIEGLDIEGTSGHGIVGSTVTGPIVLNRVAVRNPSDSAIFFEDCSGITCGDAAGPDLLIDAPGQRGLEASGGYPTLTLDGVEVVTAEDAFYLEDTHVIATRCFAGRSAQGAVGMVQRGVVVDHSGTTPMTATLRGWIVEHSTAEAVVANASGTAPLTLGLEDSTFTGGLVTTDTGGVDQLRLHIEGSDFTAAPGDKAVRVTGQALHSSFVTGLDQVRALGTLGGGGVLFEQITFDADPQVMGIQTVAGGSVAVGVDASTRVDGDGLRFEDPTGDLSVSTLDVFNASGTGIYVDTKGSGTTFNLTVGGGAVNTIGGAPLFLDPPAHMPSLGLGIELDSVTGGAGLPSGILIDNAHGYLRIGAPVTTGIQIRNAPKLRVQVR